MRSIGWWNARLFQLARSAAQGVKLLLKPTGLGRLSVVQALRLRGRQQMLRRLQRGNLLLIEAGGQPMYVFNDPHFVGVYVNQSYEPYTVQLFKHAVKPGAIVLDIGANVGYFSLIAARRAGSRGKVFAFEPAPENFELLKRNIEFNDLFNITPVPKAVSNESRVATLTLGELSDQHSLFRPALVAATGTVDVECVALDDFLDGITPDVIKMDIEGNELCALDGMRRTVARSDALAMIVELNPVCLREASANALDLVLKLRRLGFDLCVIDEDARSLSPVTDNYLRNIEQRPAGWFANLYCTKGLPSPCSS